MSLAFGLHFLADLLLVLFLFTVPGLYFLERLGFRGESLADRMLGSFALSMAYLCLAVTLLGFAGVYVQATLLAVLAWPAIGLWQQRASLNLQLHWPRMDWYDRCAAALLGCYLALAFLDASTTPFYGWDAMITWDAWAAGWGGRANINGYLFGGYPQLLPILGSILYKLGASAGESIPVEAFLFHAMHPLFAGILFIAVYRLCTLWKAPFGLAALALAGIPAMQQNLTMGGADMLTACTVTCFAALLVSRAQGAWQTELPESIVVGASMYAAFSSKATGILVLLLFGLVWASSRIIGMPLVLRRAGLSVLIPAAGIVLFYGQQSYQESSVPMEKLSAFDQNYSMAGVRASVSGATAGSMGGKGYADRLARFGNQLLEGDSIESSLKLAALACLLLSLAVPSLRPIAVFVLFYFFFWLGSASYDYRNLLPAMPAAAALTAAGAQWAADKLRAAHELAPKTLSTGYALLLVLLALPIATPANTLLPLLSLGQAGIGTRLSLMAQPQDERVKAFFPAYYRDLHFLRQSHLLDTHPNLIATSSFFRLVPQGIYPLKTFSYAIVKPGDVAAAHAAYPIGTADTWTPVRTKDSALAVFEPTTNGIPAKGLSFAGTSAPKRVGGTDEEPQIEFTGTNSVLAVNLLSGSAGISRAALTASSVTFRIEYQQSGPTAPIEPIILSYPQATVVDAATGLAQTSKLADGVTILQSGIVTFPAAIPGGANDAVLVGLRCHVAGVHIQLKKFAFTQYSGKAPQPLAAAAAPRKETGDVLLASDAAARAKMEGLTSDGWMLKDGISIRYDHPGANFKKLRINGEIPGVAGHIPVRIAVSAAGATLPPIVIAAPGPVSLTIALPASMKESIALKLTPDKGFVPKLLGINEDPRALCLRIQSITME